MYQCTTVPRNNRQEYSAYDLEEAQHRCVRSLTHPSPNVTPGSKAWHLRFYAFKVMFGSRQFEFWQFLNRFNQIFLKKMHFKISKGRKSISWKVDEIKCPYFLDLMHIWPYFRCLLLRPLLILKCIFFKKIWLNLFENWQNSICLYPNINLKA